MSRQYCFRLRDVLLEYVCCEIWVDDEYAGTATLRPSVLTAITEAMRVSGLTVDIIDQRDCARRMR